MNVLWFDNFSKFYAAAVPGISKGAFSSCMWTGLGLHSYIGPQIDTKMKPGERAMPLSLFEPAGVAVFQALMQSVDADGKRLLSKSLLSKYSVCSVPLKPVVDATTEPQLARVLSESRDGMVNFTPLEMLGDNVGSNRGLLLILRDLFAKQRKPGHYSFLSVDCNIFMRILKVITFFMLFSLILMTSRHVYSSCTTCLELGHQSEAGYV